MIVICRYMCQQSVSDTVRQWPGVWQEVESAINISSQKLDFFSKSLHFVKGSLGKTQKTQHLAGGWTPHQYFLIMEVSLIVIFWCVLDFSKVDLFCLLCYLSKVLSTSLYSVMNTMCFGSFKSGSVCPHALEAFCSSKKDAPLWEWYTSRSSPRSHDSIFIQRLHDGKFKRNKIFNKILFYGPCLSRGKAPPKFHNYMNSFCLCYFFLSDPTLSCLVVYSHQSLLFSGLHWLDSGWWGYVLNANC